MSCPSNQEQPLAEDDMVEVDAANESPDSVNHLREFAVERIDEVMKRAFRIIRYSRNTRVVIDSMALAFGWYSEIGGVTNSTELSKRLKCSKANITKFVKQFQDVLPPAMNQIEPMPGQRSNEARAKFAQTRNTQCQ
jgi:KaiC/GvpD/RAD55 family RecA-like ATPase